MNPLLRSTLVITLVAAPVFADGPYRNRDNKNAAKDSAEGTYPVPYQQPTVPEVTEALARVRDYLDQAALTRIVDSATGREITDPASAPVATAAADRGESEFGPLQYEMGVVHSAMLRAAVVTGDAKFAAYTQKHLEFLAKWLPYFRESAKKFGTDKNGFRSVLEPRALDDSGSMCAAVIRARRAKVGPDLKPVIDTWSEWIGKKQFRFKDGTLARQRPQALSLWADDAYMSVPALAEMGHLTGERAWFDDAVKQIERMSSYLFNPQLGLYTHGWNAANHSAPHFYWGRATGWIVVAMCDLLDVLPKAHPGREKVLAQLRATLRGVAQYQSGSGLWHQMIDRNDSYLETSATAMFVYGLAHAVNEGWIPATTYGSIAQAGWCGLVTRINAKGQIEGTCVGTTYASDQVYYYNRPASVKALHGYGTTMLAGVEIIRLLKNPAFTIDYKLRTYHYVPKDSATSYREHL
ncbi:MAG: glycoside hydrolase family 88 protein [Verrucomicrobia bacterium]|nr:glycoside hydrolase family 88 protein [Verrucomicrobiota bacterium]